MLTRNLGSVAFDEAWGRQMRFITGPRQTGKTTLARAKLAAEKTVPLYYLWDLRSVRNRYKANELFFTEDGPPRRNIQWVCFDEIHKMPRWKNILKAIFDSTEDRYRFIVTGSAKFDLFKKAGDSLSGRYFTFHLFPLSVRELISPGRPDSPPDSARDYILERLDQPAPPSDVLSGLLEFSGFPEPYLRHSRVFYSKWSADYADTVIKEDIGALTRIIDREHLFDLYNLLPEMISSPISESSLASHLELSHPTIKNYLNRLADFFLVFKVRPYARNVKRALLKAPKIYLFDWARTADQGKRFENFLAVQWMARLSLWGEATADRYGLFYVRTKQKEEADFLIVKNDRPWLMAEAKWSDGAVAGHLRKLQAMLGGIPLVQVCRQEKVSHMEGRDIYRISASRFLS